MPGEFLIDFAPPAALIGGARPLPPSMSSSSDSSPTPLAEISQQPSAFEQFLDRHQKSLAALGVLLALGTLGWVAYKGIQDSKEESAGHELSAAKDLPSVLRVSTNHPTTKAGQTALILLADRQWADGRQDDAIASLESFLKNHPQHPAAGTAKTSLAVKLASQGKSPQAATLFEEVANDPRAIHVAPFAMIRLGDIAKLGGDLAKAESWYSRAAKDFPKSSFATTANERIASCKALPPLEIEPPPPPKAPTGEQTKAVEKLRAELPPEISVNPVNPDAPATNEASPTAPAPDPSPPAEP